MPKRDLEGGEMTPERMIKYDLDNIWKAGLNLKARRPDCLLTESLMGLIAQARRAVLAQLDEIKASDQVGEARAATLEATYDATSVADRPWDDDATSAYLQAIAEAIR